MIDYAAARAGGRRWCRGCCGATRRGARGSPSRAPAATSARSRAGRSRTDDGWRVTGQKVWTSLAQYAQRCVLLTRTGTPESAHRGITALFVDMDTPGITVAADRDDARRARVLRGLLRRRRSCPFDRTLGDEGQGWAVAMDLLPVRAQHRAVAPRRVPPPPAAAAARRCADPGALDPGEARRGDAARSTRSGPAPAPPSTGWPRGETLGRGDVDRQGAAGDGRAGRVRPRRRRRCPADGHDRRRRRRASGGGPSSSTRGRRRSTAAAPRSSATSSPAACSTSGTTDDRRRRPRAVRAQPAQRDRAAHRRRARRRARGARLARRARRSTRAPRCRGCSSCRARPTPRPPRSTTSSRSPSVASSTARPSVVLPAIGRWQPPGQLDSDRVTVARPRHRGAGRRTLRGRRHRRRARRRRGRHVGARRCGRCTASIPWLGLVRGRTARSRSTSSGAAAGRLGSAAVALAQLALGHELVGASRTMLALAREHAARARAVRPADRAVPGRPPPPGRHPRRHRDGRRGARRRVARPVAR